MGLNSDLVYGQTPLDDSEIEGILIRGVTKRQELDEFEHLNIEKANKWAFRPHVKKEKLLSEAFIKLTHAKMFGDVWAWAGTFRRTNKNVGVEWYQIPTELQQLLDDCAYWIEHDIYTPDEIAVRFKHRLVYIHCFANGNGRHSRLMADLIITKIFNGIAFNWLGTREAYISAIKAADMNNIVPLIQFARG